MSGDLLLDRLRAEGTAVSSQVLGEMYAEDPFWNERFGARGRGHADRDGAYHVLYLIEAIAAADPQLLVKYGTWLRDVLCGRGMASRHLMENFDRLGAAITARGWNGAERAVATLAEASDALVHRAGPGGDVEAVRASWAVSLAAELDREAPHRAAAAGNRPHWTVDADLYVWYLADALALDLPTGFDAHLVAVRAFEARAGHPSVVPVVTRHLARAAREAGMPGRTLAILAEAGKIGAIPA